MFSFRMKREWMTGVPQSQEELVIYSFTKEDMLLFLKQHNFNLEFVNIDYISDTIERVPVTHILQTYHFKSNQSPEIYHIKTCEYFVNAAVTTVGDHLSDACLLGSAIFRDDIEFIEIVTDIFDKLPYVDVIDYSLLDGDSSGMGSDIYSWMIVKKDLLFDDGYEPNFDQLDNSFIYDALSKKSDPDQIQPITIEAYVRSFTESILSLSL